MFSDGKAIVEINPDRFARCGVKIYDNSHIDVERLGKTTEIRELEDGIVACDPNGIYVYLPAAKHALASETGSAANGITGNFVGLSIEAHDFSATVEFWEAMGYKRIAGGIENGWAKHSNGSAIDLCIMKTMMCPHLFFNPGMTYFNGKKNAGVIDDLRKAGIPLTEEITRFNDDGVVDNVIFRDPGGLGFFIFND